MRERNGKTQRDRKRERERKRKRRGRERGGRDGKRESYWLKL